MADAKSYPKAIPGTPTQALAKLLSRYFGAARFAYNSSTDSISITQPQAPGHSRFRGRIAARPGRSAESADHSLMRLRPGFH